MSKVRCSACGAVFSSRRNSCPECNHPRNRGGARLKEGSGSSKGRTFLIVILILAIVLCLVILAVLLFGGQNSNTDTTPNNQVEENGDDLNLPSVIDVDGINEGANNGETTTPDDNTTTTPVTPPDDDTTVEPTPTVTVTDIKLNTLYDSANACYDATLPFGSSFQFTARTTPADQEVTWSIDKTTVAQVDETGYVTAVGRGQCTMTVTSGGHTVTCILRVN